MRNKIREIMNKEEGFTLVELLAVIVILGIIVAIAIPAVGSVIDRADSDADKAEIALIEDAGRLYFTTNHDKEDLGNWVTVDDLHTQGFIEERGTTDSEDENSLPTGGVQRISNGSKENVTYTYEYSETKPGENDN